MKGPNMPNENNGLDLASKVIPDHPVPYSKWPEMGRNAGSKPMRQSEIATEANIGPLASSVASFSISNPMVQTFQNSRPTTSLKPPIRLTAYCPPMRPMSGA